MPSAKNLLADPAFRTTSAFLKRVLSYPRPGMTGLGVCLRLVLESVVASNLDADGGVVSLHTAIGDLRGTTG